MTKFCTQCGHKITGNGKFCTNCGAHLNDGAVNDEPQESMLKEESHEQVGNDTGVTEPSKAASEESVAPQEIPLKQQGDIQNDHQSFDMKRLFKEYKTIIILSVVLVLSLVGYRIYGISQVRTVDEFANECFDGVNEYEDTFNVDKINKKYKGKSLVLTGVPVNFSRADENGLPKPFVIMWVRALKPKGGIKPGCAVAIYMKNDNEMDKLGIKGAGLVDNQGKTVKVACKFEGYKVVNIQGLMYHYVFLMDGEFER